MQLKWCKIKIGLARNAISPKPANCLRWIAFKTNKIRKVVKQSVSIFLVIFAATIDKIQIGENKLGSYDHRRLYGLKGYQRF